MTSVSVTPAHSSGIKKAAPIPLLAPLMWLHSDYISGSDRCSYLYDLDFSVVAASAPSECSVRDEILLPPFECTSQQYSVSFWFSGSSTYPLPLPLFIPTQYAAPAAATHRTSVYFSSPSINAHTPWNACGNRD